MSRSLTLSATALAFTGLVVSTTSADEVRLHPIAAEVGEQLNDPEKPFTLIVDFVVRDGDEFIAIMTEPIRQTANEEGNVAYRLSQSLTEPTEFVLYEQWRDLAALDSHLKQPYLVKLVQDFEEALAAPPKLTVLKAIQVDKK